MKKLIFILSISLLLGSCNHSVDRMGYSITNATPSECEVSIVKYQSIPESVAKQVGTIELDDTGFSTFCSENQAIAIMKKDACALGADIINIKKESKPDILFSTCYRCTADFYKKIDTVKH